MKKQLNQLTTGGVTGRLKKMKSKEEVKEKIKRMCWEREIDEPKKWIRSEVEKVAKIINSTQAMRSKCCFCGKINNHDSAVMCDCEISSVGYEERNGLIID